MHSCPECGQVCTCNGDIDDLLWGEDSDEAMDCVHPCDPDGEDLEDVDMPGYKDYLEPRCRVCGCTAEQSCAGGCVWAEPDLCSRCAMVPKE